MSLVSNLLNSKIFTVRNSLMSIVFLFTIGLFALNSINFMDARSAKSDAELQAKVNDAVDNISQFKLDLSMERLAVNTAYGFDAIPDRSFSTIATEQHQKVNTLYTTINKVVASLLVEAKSTSNDENLASKYNEFKSAYSAYKDIEASVKQDIATDYESRIIERPNDVLEAYSVLINNAALLRSALETAFPANDPRISAITNLKRHLWRMLEFMNHDAAILGKAIASQSEISEMDIDKTAGFIGQIDSSWGESQAILNSNLVSSAMRAQIENIQDVFFTDFIDDVRFPLLDRSLEIADGDEEAYDINAADWIGVSNQAQAPINRLSMQAQELAAQQVDDIISNASTSQFFNMMTLIFAVLFAAVAYWIVKYRIVNPIHDLAESMTQLAQGNLKENIDHAERVDEMGSMARSVQVFKENAIERIQLEEENRQKEEDMQRQKEEERIKVQEEREEAKRLEDEEKEKRRQRRREEMLTMANDFESSVMSVVESVSGSAKNMESSAQELTGTAEETSDKSMVVTRITEQSSSNAQMVAGAAEELSASVRGISEQTNQSSSSARDAVVRTEKASDEIGQLVDAASKIGEVVQLINDIAEQTNLLALNATIEAARAGEAGKGFAVVASEVKSLATQTAKATNEIAEQVNGMQEATRTAVTAIDDIKGIITGIEETAVSIASAVDQQDSSTQEIARNANELSSGIEEVSTNISGVNQGASDTGNAAAGVLSAAQSLTTQSDELRDQVEGFLNSIRSSN